MTFNLHYAIAGLVLAIMLASFIISFICVLIDRPRTSIAMLCLFCVSAFVFGGLLG